MLKGLLILIVILSIPIFSPTIFGLHKNIQDALRRRIESFTMVCYLIGYFIYNYFIQQDFNKFLSGEEVQFGIVFGLVGVSLILIGLRIVSFIVKKIRV